MTVLVFTVLCYLNFLLFSCQGQISLPPGGDTFVVLPGENVTIAWNISGIKTSDLTSRLFGFIPTNTLLGRIIDNEDVVIEESNLKSGVAIKKPSTLILRNVDIKYNGTYDLLVDVGRVRYSSVVYVFVAVKPNATSNCSSPVIVSEGKDVTCVCSGVNGNPPANVTWYKDNVPIDGIGKQEEQTFTIPKVDGEVSGTYKCVAQSYTLTDEKPVEVEVRPNAKPNKTIISITPEKVEVGGAVAIICKSNGSPDPDFTIIHNGTKTVSITGSTYNISGVKLNDAGLYNCTATNEFGSDSDSANLTVGRRPPKPTSITSTSKKQEGTTTDDDNGGGGLGVGAIIGIAVGAGVIAVCAIVGIACCCGSKEKDGYKGNPCDEIEMNSNKDKSPEITFSPVYAAVDKNKREGKSLYATLDTLTLNLDGSKGRNEEGKPEPTQYASIDF